MKYVQLKFLAVCFSIAMIMVATPTTAQQNGYKAKLILKVAGFNRINIQTTVPGILYRQLASKNEVRYGLSDRETEVLLGTIKARPLTDTLPVSLSETRWRYFLKNENGKVIAAAETDPDDWGENLLPQVSLPGHPEWVSLYRKAWELNWHHTVTSAALPARYAYNATADDSLCYAWDACFNVLFQRYAAPAGADPVMSSLDNFYARQTPGGFISRRYKTATFRQIDLPVNQPKINAVNPPLFAWAEWEYYEIMADKSRLKSVLPGLIKQYEFIDHFLQEKPGKYVWGGNPSGWDNILEVQKHYYWVELPAMQALSAQCIAKMAGELHDKETARRFTEAAAENAKMMPAYWNSTKGWFCSLDKGGQFTGKTLSGMWPVLAGVASADQMRRIVKNLLDTNVFMTKSMPLPSLAKDENGYEPRGKYWHGAVWINTSLLTIRALETYGYRQEARELAIRTLDGMARVYQQWQAHPQTLWECYAPDFPAPASNKHAPELGSVRSDFADWTCCLINLLIENTMGIKANAPANSITWQLWNEANYGIKNLRFAKTITSMEKRGSYLTIATNKAYRLRVVNDKKTTVHLLHTGKNVIRI